MGEHVHAQAPEVKTAKKAAAGKAAPVPQRIVAAPEADFGDIIVGETEFRDIHVFNQDHDIAFLSAHVEGGADAFHIASKPNHINPSFNGFDPTAFVRVSYSSASRSNNQAILVATLRWRDGSSESVRIALRGRAHRSNELSHDDQNEQVAEQEAKQRKKQEEERTAEVEEQRIRAKEAKGGSEQRVITNAAARLAARLDNLFSKQKNGVDEAARIVATYKRKPPTPPPPDVVKELAMLALDLAAGGLVSMLKAGINSGGAGWAKNTPESHGDYYNDYKKTPAQPGSKALSTSPVGPILGFVVDKVLTSGTDKIKAAAGSAGASELGQGSASESVSTQIEYFGVQSDLLADKKLETELNTIQLKRSLIDFDNPRDAPKAAAALDKAGAVLQAKADAARTIQAAETMKGWIRYVSHSSMGSVEAERADAKGLKQTKDGSATANIENAHASKPYDGVLELEFTADPHHANAGVSVTSARLFGVSAQAARSLQLDRKPLSSAGLPIRARTTQSSEPVHVSIARDEAGNVRFTDESGAVGMPTPWLSRRGGKAGSESAAQSAAKKLIDDLASKTLSKLGVTLETDGSDV